MGSPPKETMSSLDLRAFKFRIASVSFQSFWVTGKAIYAATRVL